MKKILFTVIIAFKCLVAAVPVQWVNPKPQGNELRAIAWSGSKFVAVGKFGAIITSIDGDNWVMVNTAVNNDLEDICWSGNKFVAVGDTVLTSTDGLSWVAHANPKVTFCSVMAGNDCLDLDTIVERFKAISFKDDIFVAVGHGIFYSYDGEKWIQAQYSDTLWGDFIDVINDKRNFIAANKEDAIVYSGNGQFWNSFSWNLPAYDELISLHYVDGFPLADSINDCSFLVTRYGSIHIFDYYDILPKTNYKLFANRPDLESIRVFKTGVAYDSNRIILVTDDEVDSSHTLGASYYTNNWSILSSPFSSLLDTFIVDTTSYGDDGLCDIVWNGNKFVAVGQYGRIIQSNDGTRWSSITNGTWLTDADICWNGTYLIISNNTDTIWFSQNGYNWNKKIFSLGLPINKVYYLEGKTIASTGRHLSISDNNLLNWETVSFPRFPINDIVEANGEFIGISHHGKYVADYVYYDSIRTSSDLVNWVSIGESPRRIKQMVFADSFFIALSDSEIIMTSEDARSWNQYRIPSSSGFWKIGYHCGKILAVTDDGTIMLSTNGEYWSSVYSGKQPLRGISCSGNNFVVSGWSGTILFSRDAINWQLIPQITTNNLGFISWTGKQFYVLGAGGTILSVYDTLLSSVKKGFPDNGTRSQIKRLKLSSLPHGWKIDFSVPWTENKIIELNVNMSIYDLQGRHVSTLVDRKYKSGNYSYSIGDIHTERMNLYEGLHLLVVRIDKNMFPVKLINLKQN